MRRDTSSAHCPIRSRSSGFLEQRGDRARKAVFTVSRIDQPPVHPIGQPFANPADVERDRGPAERRGVESGQAEGLGPEAGDGHQQTSSIHPGAILEANPPRQLERHAERRGQTAPGLLLRSVAGHDDANRPPQQARRPRRGGDEDVSALERRHPPGKEHRVGLAAACDGIARCTVEKSGSTFSRSSGTPWRAISSRM